MYCRYNGTVYSPDRLGPDGKGFVDWEKITQCKHGQEEREHVSCDAPCHGYEIVDCECTTKERAIEGLENQKMIMNILGPVFIGIALATIGGSIVCWKFGGCASVDMMMGTGDQYVVPTWQPPANQGATPMQVVQPMQGQVLQGQVLQGQVLQGQVVQGQMMAQPQQPIMQPAYVQPSPVVQQPAMMPLQQSTIPLQQQPVTIPLQQPVSVPLQQPSVAYAPMGPLGPVGPDDGPQRNPCGVFWGWCILLGPGLCFVIPAIVCLAIGAAIKPEEDYYYGCP